MRNYDIDFMDAEMGVLHSYSLDDCKNVIDVLKFILDNPMPSDTVSITIISEEE